MDMQSRDRELIDVFLSAEGKVAEPLLFERLEECEQCRDYFDQQIASNDEWLQARQLLKQDDFDLATKYWYSAGSNAAHQIRQSVSIKEVLATLAPTDDPHRLGRLGKYEVMAVIGAGGMGVVLKAFEPSLDRVVAIKVLAPHLANNDKARQRFAREARAAAAVINPNVIPIYSVASDGKLPYLVMACIQGGSLQQRLDAEGAASVPEVLRIGSQIASGLAAAHEQGLVHRDIKPENILFEGDVERVSITDFGLARAVDDNTVTQAGTIAGTPMYMSPEQARGEQLDQQSDLFSLGSVLYALCTGQPPYRADSSLGVMRKITDNVPTKICELNSEAPKWLCCIVEKLMARDKADRFETAAEVRDLLESCLSHVQAPETVPLPKQLKTSGSGEEGRLKTRTAIGLGGLLLGLLAAVVFFIVTNNGVVKLEVLDDSFQVAIDGKSVTVTEEGNNQPIKLRVGDHKLTVKAGGTEFVTSDFEIRRNGKVAFRIEPLEGKVIVTRDGMQVASKPMPGIVAPETSIGDDNHPQVAEAPAKPKVKLLTDLPASDLSAIYQALTGAELGGKYVSDKPNPRFANDLNILLANQAISRDAIAKHLVESGRPDLAEYVLVDGRINPSATEALKLADLLVESGDGAKAIDSYLQAFRIAPLLFDPWEHIEIFDKQNRLKDLAELFTEEQISKTKGGSVDPMHYLLRRLMKDDVRASLGLPFAVRLWNGRPEMRPYVLDETPMNEVPNRAEWYAALLIPEDVGKVGKGWHWLFFTSGTSGGYLYELRNILDKESARQLITKIKPLVEKHENWIAGQVTLAAMEAIAGNYEPAKQWIKDNHETVREFRQQSDYHELLWWYARYLGDVLGGRDRELDKQVIKLYEESLDHRPLKSLYRKTCVHQLARLYHKLGRKQDALDLLYGLAVRERDINEYVGNNWSNPNAVNLDLERIWDIRTAVATLNGIGYPMDALSLLSRIDFEQRRKAGIFKGGWEYKDEYVDQATSKSQKLLNTKTIVEAINRGVIPIGLASTIDKESGEVDNPIAKLLEQVARKELSSEVAASFKAVNAKLVDADAMDLHLGNLMKQHTTDVDIAVAAAIFAFLRDDIETAAKRLQVLDSSLGADYEARAADVNLYLAAGFAKKHADTADIGARLAIRSAQSGKQMTEEWQQFFASEVPATPRQKPATARSIMQRIKMDLNPAELRQLTDELLEIYRNGPGGLPRKQIGGDRLVFNAFKKAGRLVELGKCIGETAELSEECDLVTARETIEALMKDDQTRALAYQTLEKAFKVSHEVRSQVLAYPENFGVDWKTAPNAIIYLRASLLPARLNRYQRPFSKSLFGNKKGCSRIHRRSAFAACEGSRSQSTSTVTCRAGIRDRQP